MDLILGISVSSALIILATLLFSLFFARRAATPPFYQQHFAWRIIPRGIWFLALLLFVGGSILVAFLVNPSPPASSLFVTIPAAALTTALLAPPAALLFAQGCFDFSVGAIATLAGMIFISFANQGHPVSGAAVALALALAVGLVNGLVVAIARLSSVIVTLTMAGLFVGIVQYLANDSRPLLERQPADYTRQYAPLWWILAVLACAVLFLLAELTAVGRPPRPPKDPQSPESTPRRLLSLGVPYLASALAAGIAGIYLALRLRMVSPFMGSSFLFLRDGLLAVVLGGTAWKARNPALFGALAAALLLEAFRTLLYIHYPTLATAELFLSPALLVFALLALQYHNLIAALYHRKHQTPTTPATPT